MKKKTEHNASTERVLKSKYLDKDKQKTISLLNRSSKKIKLVDLCPEEKLKIGQLIKTLEVRKKENERIADQNSDLANKYETCLVSLESLRQQLQQKQESFVAINMVITQKDSKIKEQEVYICSLQQELVKCKNMLEPISQKERFAVQIQTESITVIDVAVQINKKKKKKNKNKKDFKSHISGNEPEINLFYRPHSKSFDKIMKGTLPVDGGLTTSFQEYATTQKYTNMKDTINRYNQKSSPEINYFSSEPEQSVQSLAQRWKQIKQKTKGLQYNQASFFSKQRLQHHNHVLEESDEDDSAGAEQHCKNKMGESMKIEDYDQRQLNKLLKLKNFSANKLLKGGQNSSVKKGSQKHSPEVSYLKSPYFNNNLPQFSEQSKSKCRFQHQTSTDGNINFFESDILELAQRINL